VQQHVHVSQVVGGDVLLFRRLPPPPHPAGSLCETKAALPPRPFVLAVDLADAPMSTGPHAVAHVQQQGAGAAGEVHRTVQPLLGAGLRFMAVQRDDGGEDVGNVLRRVELARLLAGPGGKLADQLFLVIKCGIAGFHALRSG